MSEELRMICLPVSTFAPAPFEIVRPFGVVVLILGVQFEATQFEAEVSAVGDSLADAVAKLKDAMLMIYTQFEGREPVGMDPKMARRLAVIRDLIRRKEGV
jgi:hypothetical protein